MRILRYFRLSGGEEPYWEWLDALGDRNTRARILARIDRLEEGNFGDHRFVGEGVVELRMDFGPGYRIYCGQDGPVIILLLCGGDKSTQDADINKAKGYWRIYRTGGRTREKG